MSILTKYQNRTMFGSFEKDKIPDNLEQYSCELIIEETIEVYFFLF